MFDKPAKDEIRLKEISNLEQCLSLFVFSNIANNLFVTIEKASSSINVYYYAVLNNTHAYRLIMRVSFIFCI